MKNVKKKQIKNDFVFHKWNTMKRFFLAACLYFSHKGCQIIPLSMSFLRRIMK